MKTTLKLIENGAMRRVTAFVFALATVVVCSQLLSQGRVERDRGTVVVNVPQETQAKMVFAIVAGIDYQSGLVVLDSAIGQLLTIATPAQLDNLHAGDLVLVRLDKEDHQKERPQNEAPGDTLII